MRDFLKNKIERDLKSGKLIHWKTLFDEEMKDPKRREEYEKHAKEFEAENAKLLQLNLAKKIKKARILSGKTQEELAKIIKTKKSYISKVESGEQNISVEYIVKVANALKKHLTIDIN